MITPALIFVGAVLGFTAHGQDVAHSPQPPRTDAEAQLRLKIQLQFQSIENYAWYGSQRGSKHGAKDQFDSKTEIEQYYGDSGTAALRGKATVVVDGAEISLAGAIDLGPTSFMKAIDVKSRGREKFYELIVPEAADLNYLGDDRDLKRKCFPYLKPAATLWKAMSVSSRSSRTIAPRNADVLVAESKNSQFTSIKTLGDLQTSTNLLFDLEGFRFEIKASPSSVLCEAQTTVAGVAGPAGKFLRCSISSPFELNLLIQESYDPSRGNPMGAVLELAGLSRLLGVGGHRGSIAGAKEWGKRPELFTSWLADLVEQGVGVNNAILVRSAASQKTGGFVSQQPAAGSEKSTRRTFAQAGPAACSPEVK